MILFVKVDDILALENPKLEELNACPDIEHINIELQELKERQQNLQERAYIQIVDICRVCSLFGYIIICRIYKKS